MWFMIILHEIVCNALSWLNHIGATKIHSNLQSIFMNNSQPSPKSTKKKGKKKRKNLAHAQTSIDALTPVVTLKMASSARLNSRWLSAQLFCARSRGVFQNVSAGRADVCSAAILQMHRRRLAANMRPWIHGNSVTLTKLRGAVAS